MSAKRLTPAQQLTRARTYTRLTRRAWSHCYMGRYGQARRLLVMALPLCEKVNRRSLQANIRDCARKARLK